MTWELNVPRCLCEPCYQNWLEWGKELYKDNPKRYGERIESEKISREQRRSSKNLAKQGYTPSFA